MRMLLILLLAAVPVLADETITLETAETKQTWIAFLTEPFGPTLGTSHTDLMDATTVSEIVDAYVNDLGFTGFIWKPALEWVNSENGYEPTNDNADPFSFPGGWLTGTFYPQVENDFFMNVDAMNDKLMFDEIVDPVQDAVVANGEDFTLIINICCQYSHLQTHWKYNATDYADEYAEFGVALIQWITDSYSFQPAYWNIPLNEPADAEYANDTPREPVKEAAAFNSRMATEGWATQTSHNEAIRPEIAIEFTAFCDADATCKAEAGLLSYHSYDYDGVDQPTAGEITNRNTLRTRAASWGPGGAGVPTAMLEICCSAFVGGQNGLYSQGLQQARDIFWNMTEADVSMWMPLQMLTPCVRGGGGGDTCTSGSGLGDPFTIAEISLDDWFKFPSYYALRQYSKYIRPGMIRVDTSCVGCASEPTTGDTAKVVVFKTPDASPDDRHVIVAINDRSTSTIMTFSGFPPGLYEFEGIYDAICPNTAGERERCTPHTGKFLVYETDWVFRMPAEAIYTFSQVYVADKYGGFETIDAAGGATGAWYVEKFNDRWMFVTPEGHPFWSTGVFFVGATSNAVTKYGDADLTWGPQQVRRLHWWGFNTVLSFTSKWATPSQSDGGWPGDDTQPEKTPQIFVINTTNESWRNTFGFGTQASKELHNPNDDTQGTDTTYYTAFQGPTPDPFDPYLLEWYEAQLQAADLQVIGNHAWTIGMATAESDFVNGFGAGDDFVTIPGGFENPHLGAVVLVTSPTQDENTQWSVTYTDEEVYAKTAFRVFMEAKYATIGDLNTAWSSNYSTFGSSPTGWGQNNTAGTLDPFGLLDENGSSPWVGTDFISLSGMTATMQTDLDDFLFDHADKLFDVLDTPLAAEFPNLMHFGPNVIGSWVGPPRRQILQAAANHLDVVMTSVGTPDASDQARLDFYRTHYGDKPLASWLGIVADDDSAMSLPNPITQFPMDTQEERGTKYDELMNIYLDAAYTTGGGKPYVGVRWWAYVDSPGENANWGLVSPTDNAYDGTEAIIAAGTDQWGFDTGGESADYGDFLNAAQLTNGQILEALFLELLAMDGNGNGNGAPATISGKVAVSGKVVIQ